MEHDFTDRSLALAALGWGPFYEASFAVFAAQGMVPARVAVEHRGGYVTYSPGGELSADLAGRLRHEAVSRLELPAVGDWVALRVAPGARHGTVHAVVPRRTAFVRQAAGGAPEPQVIAANVDVVLVAMALWGDLSPRRLERYLAAVRASGAACAVVLTKLDLCDSPGRALAEVSSAAGGAPVHAVSSVTGAGLDALASYFAGHRTVAVVGSSGVGKSTLVNALVGEARLETRANLATGRGQHTTTRRELVARPGGGLLLDTPGMRELALWGADADLGETFGDVESLAARCRFRDCAHEREPGCAVRAALDSGALDPGRWEGHQKLLREQRAWEQRQDPRVAAEARRQLRARARGLRSLEKSGARGGRRGSPED